MKKIHILPFLFFLLFSCNKDDDVTLASDNIFRCKVNGVDWTPDSPSGTGTILGGELDIYYERVFLNSIEFSASKDIDIHNQFLKMFINVNNGLLGEHKIINNTVFTDFNLGCSYKRDTTLNNIINISSIDSIHQILSGTFNFTGLSTDCPGEIVKITDGYFKAHYR